MSMKSCYTAISPGSSKVKFSIKCDMRRDELRVENFIMKLNDFSWNQICMKFEIKVIFELLRNLLKTLNRD